MQKLRRSMLFVPGNNPGMLRDAHIYGADALMFDLEDSVSIYEKDAARLLVYNALKSIAYGRCELVVRVNPLNTPFGAEDIRAVVHAGVHVVRMPKTETAADVTEMAQAIGEVEQTLGRPVGSTKMLAAVESALGVLNAREIAAASDRLVGIALGAEDYVANLKTNRSAGGIELLFARSQILLAARAAGIDALDTVYSDVNNMEGFEEEARLIKQLGFDGKSCINPRQIGALHRVFTPTDKEIERSIRIIAALKEAEAKGSGVISLDGRMIDRPVVLRAQRVLDYAAASGIPLSEDEV